MSSKIPILFIPGLFGSMSAEIIPGTGSWHFGFSRYTGKRFVKEMLRQGYTLNVDLFIMYYNWLKPCTACALDILMPLIKKVCTLSNAPYVNIICHGTGGLIARAYAQSHFYSDDIHKLILIGTPNDGFLSAFSFYSGGFLPNHCSYEPDFLSFNLYLYTQLIKNTHTSPALSCQKMFPSLNDFIPSTHFGDFLFYNCQKTTYFIPREQMVTTSPFLDSLQHTAYLLDERHIPVVMIAGTGERTLENLEVLPCCQKESWHDGKVIGCTHSLEGDGSTLVRSVFALEGEHFMLRYDYGELLLQSATLLPSLL